MIKRWKKFIESLESENDKVISDELVKVSKNLSDFKSKRSGLESIYKKGGDLSEEVEKFIDGNPFLKKYSAILLLIKGVENSKARIENHIDKKNHLKEQILDLKSILIDTDNDGGEKINIRIKKTEESIKKQEEMIKLEGEKMKKIEGDLSTKRGDFDDFIKMEEEKIKKISEK